jgi:hypothetical protein
MGTANITSPIYYCFTMCMDSSTPPLAGRGTTAVGGVLRTISSSERRELRRAAGSFDLRCRAGVRPAKGRRTTLSLATDLLLIGLTTQLARSPSTKERRAAWMAGRTPPKTPIRKAQPRPSAIIAGETVWWKTLSNQTSCTPSNNP